MCHTHPLMLQAHSPPAFIYTPHSQSIFFPWFQYSPHQIYFRHHCAYCRIWINMLFDWLAFDLDVWCRVLWVIVGCGMGWWLHYTVSPTPSNFAVITHPNNYVCVAIDRRHLAHGRGESRTTERLPREFYNFCALKGGWEVVSRGCQIDDDKCDDDDTTMAIERWLCDGDDNIRCQEPWPKPQWQKELSWINE